MPLRDVFRRKRRERRAVADEPLSEQDVQRLQRVQRSAASSVRIVRGRRS